MSRDAGVRASRPQEYIQQKAQEKVCSNDNSKEAKPCHMGEMQIWKKMSQFLKRRANRA